MKPNASDEAEPAPGDRQKGENAGVAPEPKPGQTTGDTQPKQKQDGQPTKQEAQPKQDQQAKPNKSGEAQTGKAAGEARPAPKITSVQQTKIQETIKTVNVRPVHVDFDVNVGVAVPRTVVLEPLPPAIITIVPAYRGYRFFLVSDEIVIVDPLTFEVVAILPL